MDADTQVKIKNALLERFQVDPVSLIKKSIAGVIGSLCKMLIPNREWDDLFKFVMQFSQSENVADQELALLLLSVIIEYLGKDDIKEHFDNISLILLGAIKSQQPSIVDFGITCINNIAKATSNVKVLKWIQQMLPDILNTLTDDNEDRIQLVLDCLISLVEYKGLLTPQLVNIMEGAIKICANTEYRLETRSRAIAFFEFLPMNNTKTLKKKKELLNRIVSTLMKISWEPENEYPEDTVTPNSYALFSIKSFGVHMHKPIIFPIIIKNINACIQSTVVNERKAGIELLGLICESDGCLDPIKDHIDEITEVIVKCLYDESIEVKSTTAETVGMFSENVSEFLDKVDIVVPALVNTIRFLENHDLPLQKALHALHTFVNGAEYSKITNIMKDLIPVLLVYLEPKPSNTIGVQKWTMEIISSIVIAADKEIEEYFDILMGPWESIYKNTPAKEGELKSQALDTIGHLAKAVGRERFTPYLEYYTQEALKTITDEDNHWLRETSFSYLCSISKFMREEMASIIPVIVTASLFTINRDDIRHVSEEQKIKEYSLDSDSEQEQVYGKIEAFDEKASAIHCLGYLFKFCPTSMLPYLEEVSQLLLKMTEYVEDNVRFECISSITTIAIGLNIFENGEDFEWLPGFENPTPLGEKTCIFLEKVYFPTLAIVFDTEDANDVIERMMQSLIEVTDVLGPAVYEDRLDQILILINNLLENKDFGAEPKEGEGGEGDFEDLEEGHEEEDIDHNEMVLANVTELVTSVARALGEDLTPHFEKTAELLFMHLGDNYPMRDKSLCIGCLGECFNSMPSLLKKWFNEFYTKVVSIMKNEKNEELLRNCAFALGTLSLIEPKLMKNKSKDTYKLLTSMIDRVKDEGCKDNVVSALFKLATYNFDSWPYKSMIETLYSNIPLKDDLDENEQIAKWCILLFEKNENSMKPYMTDILKTIMWAVIEPTTLTKDPVRRELAGWLKNTISTHGEYGQLLEELSIPLTQEQKDNFQRFCP